MCLSSLLSVSQAVCSENSFHDFKKNFLAGYRLLQTGQSQKALTYLQRVKNFDVSVRDYVLFYLGKASLDQKECDVARQVFQELSDSYPESRWISYAQAQLESADPCPPLIPLRKGVEEKAGCDDLSSAPDRANCFFQSRRYAQAKAIYQGLQDTRGKEGIFYLTRLSQSAARSQDFETAIRANETIRARASRSSAADEALRKIAFLYQDARRYREALPVLEDLLRNSRTQQEKRSYRERMGWCYFQLQDYEKAISSFDSALEIAETPFLLYWKGRSLEKLGRRKEAGGLFRNLIDIYPASYYGIRALERLELKNFPLRTWWSSLKEKFQWQKKTEVISGTPVLAKAHELMLLGLLSDAETEMRRARAESNLPFFSDLKFLAKDGDHFRFLRRYPREESPDYPLPYADSLFSGLQRSKSPVDPFLLYAMMRQESRYRESVVSPAGAIGLLQIMPGTGRRLAEDALWEEYRSRWLYVPAINIELAIQYVNKLHRQFGKWHAVAASYNAGEKVVAEWLKARSDMPEEEFIEEIPYMETRDYVKKIYTNWKAYRSIYRKK